MNPIVKKHSIAGLLTTMLAIVFYISSLSLPPAAYQLPRILAVVIIFLSISMVLEVHLDRKKKSEKESRSKEAVAINYTRAFIFGLLIAAYIFAIKPLGYFIVTPIYVTATYLFLKASRLTNVILIAFGFTVFVYMVFVFFLKVPIPLGPI